MKTFYYRAKAGPDRTVKGKVSASSVEEAVALLSREGYVPTSLKETPDEEDISFAKKNRPKPGLRASRREIISFTRQFAVLIRSGVAVVRSLDILAGRREGGKLSRVIADISSRICNGQTLSAGMSAYPEIFSPFYVSMVSAGESSGTLEKCLATLAEYYQDQARIISRIRSAVIYPAFIAVVGFATVVFVFTSVMPRIIPVLVSIDVPLPLPTRMLIAVSGFLRDQWIWISVAGALFLLTLRKALKNQGFRSNLSILRLKIPVFGRLIQRSELARFMRAMELCVKSGIPIIRATSISLFMLNEPAMRSGLDSSIGSLERGRSLSETFRGSDIIPKMAVDLVNVGEESGDLAGSLAAVADSFETDCTESVDMVLNLIEPAMVLAVGLIVGFIVMAVLLPVFQMNVVQL